MVSILNFESVIRRSSHARQSDYELALTALEVKQMDGRFTMQIPALQLFTRHALTALIKHRQLLLTLKGLASSSKRRTAIGHETLSARIRPLGSAPASAQGTTSGAGQPGGDVDGDDLQLVFAYDSKLWIKASSDRQAKDLWRDCEKRLKVGHGAKKEPGCISHSSGSCGGVYIP